MAYATTDNISDRLGRDLTASETQIVDTRLDDVEALILVRAPEIATKVVDNPTLARLLVMVESDAVLRLIRNPDGFKSETDGNYSYEIDGRVASGRLSILPEEWQLLGVRTSLYVLAPRINMPTSVEGEFDPSKPKSGPNTRPFETQWDESVWGP